MNKSERQSAAVSIQAHEQRIELAAAHRLAHIFGMTDLIHTHISSRCKDQQDQFLITPYGNWFHEVTASTLSRVNNNGALIDSGEGQSDCAINPAGFIIHEAIYSAREDANVVFHTHTISGVAVSCLASGIKPISQYAIRFFNQIAYHDYCGATLVKGERQSIQNAVTNSSVKILVLRNHGMAVIANSVAEAFMNMYFLDRACQVQMQCEKSKDAVITPSDSICEFTANQFLGNEEEDMQQKLDLEWSALLRLIEDQRESYSS